METDWEKRFTVIHALRDSQDDLWTTIDERYKDVEKRLLSVETTTAPAFARVTGLGDRLEEANVRFKRIDKENLAMTQEFKGLQKFCNDTFPRKDDLKEAEKKITDSIANAEKATNAGLQDVKNYAAAETRVAELQASIEERCNKLQHSIFEDNSEIKALQTQFKKSQRVNDETFATKIEEERDVTQLNTK